jgi:hypothetical protein
MRNQYIETIKKYEIKRQEAAEKRNWKEVRLYDGMIADMNFSLGLMDCGTIPQHERLDDIVSGRFDASYFNISGGLLG